MPANGATTRRSQIRNRTDSKIMDATLQIALTQGVGAVTIEEVSRISGVAKTTIYRRFRNSKELLNSVSAMKAIQPPQLDEIPVTPQGIESIITAVIKAFEDTVGVKSVGLMLSSDSRFFKNMVMNVLTPVRHRIENYFERGVKEGAFSPSADIDMIIDCTLGGIVTRAAISDGITQEWAHKISMFLWNSLSPHSTAMQNVDGPAADGDSSPAPDGAMPRTCEVVDSPAGLLPAGSALPDSPQTLSQQAGGANPTRPASSDTHTPKEV
ncbi:MAG: TetR/AcrR family transcriptional regulator [Bifidobacteriaceae bacterium]|nr:TetR/AcrR family transcriptional regulator [Bifidobacteriaceae bacterium]